MADKDHYLSYCKIKKLLIYYMNDYEMYPKVIKKYYHIRQKYLESKNMNVLEASTNG